MHLARVRLDSNRVALAVLLEPGRLLVLDGPENVSDDPIATLQALGAERLGEIVQAKSAEPSAVFLDEETAEFDVPVPHPQKIICLALNYADHAMEGNLTTPEYPVIFFKPPSSLLAHRATVRNPARSSRLDYELELAVVIGARACKVEAANWESVVSGYMVFNDVTARDLQMTSIQRNESWDHSKGFDTFGPCGPYLVTKNEIDDPMNLDLSLHVDGELRQSSNTRHMVFGIPKLIEWISDGITLEPGDIIATGTPSGIGPVEPGQTMKASIEGLGTLVNTVTFEGR